MKHCAVRRSSTAALALALFPHFASAQDILCLKDGRVVEGPVPAMKRVDGGIELAYKNGTLMVPDALIQGAVLASDPIQPPQNAEEQEKLVKGFVRFEGRWVTPAQRDETLAKRRDEQKKLLEEIRDHSEWRTRSIEETRYFRFEYTVPKNVFGTYRDTMEAYFAEFARAWKIKPPSKADRLPVCFHADEQSFHQVSGARPGVLGWFRFVRPWELNVFYERLDPRFSTEVMFHEANHYLQKLVDLEFAYPHFPGEALAEYYGASEWDPVAKKLTVGLIQEGRLVEVQTDIAAGERIALDRLLSEDRMYEHYTWGWTLVHFLMNDARYAAKFQKFFVGLAKDKDVKRTALGRDNLKTTSGAEVLRVFMRELGLKDGAALRKLEKDWYDYIDNKLNVVTTRGLERAGNKAFETDRPLRALRLLKDAIDKGSQNPLALHTYAKLLYFKKKQRKEARAIWNQCLTIDPLNGRFYAWLGYTLQRESKDNELEGRRLIELAKELGYDNPMLEVQFADLEALSEDE